MTFTTATDVWQRKQAQLPTLLIDVRNQNELAVFNILDVNNQSFLTPTSFTASRISVHELPSHIAPIKAWYKNNPNAQIVVACTRMPQHSPRAIAVIDALEKEGIKAVTLQQGLHALHFQQGFITITKTIL